MSAALLWSLAVAALVLHRGGAGGPRPRLPLPSTAARTTWRCPAWFLDAAARADLPAPLQRWWQGCALLSGTASLAGLLLGGPVLALLALALSAAGIRLGLHLASGRRDENLARSVPEALDALARSTRSGSSLLQALGDLDGPPSTGAARALAGAAARARRGEPLDRALDDLAARHPLGAVRLGVTALKLVAETGAPPARAVEGVAATLRERAALERESRAQATQARASAAVLVLAPVGFGLFAVATDPRVADFLFRSPVGLGCLAAGVGLDLLGAWWMASMVRGAR